MDCSVHMRQPQAYGSLSDDSSTYGCHIFIAYVPRNPRHNTLPRLCLLPAHFGKFIQRNSNHWGNSMINAAVQQTSRRPQGSLEGTSRRPVATLMAPHIKPGTETSLGESPTTHNTLITHARRGHQKVPLHRSFTLSDSIFTARPASAAGYKLLVARVPVVNADE
jgi:hypothetical protein